MVFDSEVAFEKAVVESLKSHGWDDAGGVLRYPTEQDLIDNWAAILFENNKHRDCLDGHPLTSTEMQQVIEQVVAKRTPLAINELINGKEIVITRDNPDDKLHEGRNVVLKIFHRDEIAGGSSRYQIVQQPVFPSKTKVGHDRRGDLMLLINGMPLFHIELKKSGVPVGDAAGQIQKYAHEGVFSRLFSMVQIFVAMTPEETKYFANPGPDGKFNEKLQFHWADFNNNPVNQWQDVINLLLSIPMAHQLIGYYTVADDSDGVLKVMRSYQYFAAHRISDRVTKINRDKLWGTKGLKGGYVWHTTGSGKTMTSFKCAQLIANSRDADKVVFLVDRIELGTQSLEQYRSFASATEAVQATEDTHQLKAKLRSSDPSDTLIVTSIQKMGNLDEDAMSSADLEAIRKKRLVFIVDECHRSTFGKNMETIRRSFPAAVLFGFTGTPIQDENRKKLSTTTDVFGDELHRYSIADGIRDGNVLGFDTYPVATYPDLDLRQAVALEEAKASSIEQVAGDPRRVRTYYHIMNDLPMAPYVDELGRNIHGIESMVPESQYGTPDQPDVTEHQRQVVADIIKRWPHFSRAGKFHAIFATHSIPEAIEYYHLFKQQAPDLRVTVLVDPSIDNDQGQIDRALIKQDALREIIDDYNERYGKEYTLGSWGSFKKDVSNRLAHKQQYMGIDKRREEYLDILIVVDQMLTGFDSKWINTLYLDKMLHYEMIIQAFSRTNRLFNENEKQAGTIRYYRRPHTMKKLVEDAVKLYSGDKPFGLFVPKLEENLRALSDVFEEIVSVFEADGVQGFMRLPDDPAAKGKFAKLFRELDLLLEASKVQGFSWEQLDYYFPPSEELVEHIGASEEDIPSQQRVERVAFSVPLTETDFLTLAQRYKELPAAGTRERGGADIPYDISGYLMDIDTTRIDRDYMNANFTKWLKQLELEGANAEATEAALAALHKTFASLSQDEQKYANLFIHDVQSGDVFVDPSKTFRDYITEYRRQAQDERIAQAGNLLGVDVAKLAELLAAAPDGDNLNEFSRFDKLVETMDVGRAREYFSAKEGSSVPAFRVKARAYKLLQKFVLDGGCDL
ncbi:type I restriction endonuclease subunit R, EcoR124 family [Parvibacter caecicola]|uniref:type I site-specific deoxyribonuclease n=1 Tax=Parvibacter caecicola TaxID=747645 RepID=A0A7W5GPM9_9ACTN|nr:DEAD/DEAH box helicase family protein [Parvibacter caecicola]MBB3171510.1 type I restriction enzyme R subunit [Parvibacter caecicola]MCR2040770.1 DEAD/DEAH box helicase family protein [Parvibacter caecicola]RNL08628.1 DEAD/DEAH box helicase [Parvibacter caecicola]